MFEKNCSKKPRVLTLRLPLCGKRGKEKTRKVRRRADPPSKDHQKVLLFVMPRVFSAHLMYESKGRIISFARMRLLQFLTFFVIMAVSRKLAPKRRTPTHKRISKIFNVVVHILEYLIAFLALLVPVYLIGGEVYKIVLASAAGRSNCPIYHIFCDDCHSFFGVDMV